MKKLIFLAGGALAALVAAEALLQALPVPDGIALAPPSPQWQTRRLEPGARTTMSFGWDLRHATHGTINASGFTAPFPYRDGAQVGAVIGDSYVEGLSTTENERLAPSIARSLGQPATAIYNFGVSGASLPHYLGLARIVGQRYRLQWASLVIISHDFEEGFAPQAGMYHWSETPALIAYTPSKSYGLTEKIGRRSALYRYVRMNLKFSLQSLFSSGFADEGGASGCPRATLSAQDGRLIDDWLTALPGALRLSPDRIVLTFDSDRTAYQQVGRKPSPCKTRDGLALARLKDEAKARGFRVVDTAPVFAAAWARDHRPFDHAPLDRHWTGYGNKLVAQAISNALGPKR